MKETSVAFFDGLVTSVKFKSLFKYGTHDHSAGYFESMVRAMFDDLPEEKKFKYLHQLIHKEAESR